MAPRHDAEPPPTGKGAPHARAAGWGSVHRVSTTAVDLAARVDTLLHELHGFLNEAEQSHPTAPVREVERMDAAADLAAASARLLHAAQRLQITTAGLVDTERVHRLHAERSTARWLARHQGTSATDAARSRRCAAARALYPAVAAAFDAGRLTLGHLDAISRIVPTRLRGAELAAAIARITDIQPILVATAHETTVDEFTKFCGQVRERLDVDGPGDRANDPSRIWLTRGFGGRWNLTGDLSADDGAILATILDQLAAQARQAVDDTQGDTGSAAADATVGGPFDDDHLDATEPSEPLESSTAEEPVNPAGSSVRSEQRAADLLRLALAGNGATQPGHAAIFVHIDLDRIGARDQADLLAHDAGLAHTEAGYDLTDDTFFDLLAGAPVTPILTLDGAPLSFGRTRRLAPHILRRVLAHRDRRCRFPGCDASPIDCEVHHLEFWEHAGTTDPHNLAHLCPGHHKRTIHTDGFTLTGNANEGLTAGRPGGEPLDRTPRYRRVLSPSDPSAERGSPC